jgi:hypothetical protein
MMAVVIYYETERKAKDHYRRVHLGTVFVWLECERDLKGGLSLKRHLREQHGIIKGKGPVKTKEL